MKIWGTIMFLGGLAAGCTVPAAPAPAAREEPSDAKAMVDRLRVERPSYRPAQTGGEALSVYIEAPPTYYPPVWCGLGRRYRGGKWSDCGYRPYAGLRYGSCPPGGFPRRW